MTSTQKVAANRANATKSTGPKSSSGKAISRVNALRHGVLSTVAVTENEDAGEYAALLESMRADLDPVGAYEDVLVEKIALTLWRNRRLALSESAEIAARQTLPMLLDDVTEMVGRQPWRKLGPADFDTVTASQLSWCRDVLSEAAVARTSKPEDWPTTAPAIHHQVEIELADEEDAVEMRITLSSARGVEKWLSELEEYCRNEIKRDTEAAARRAVAETAKRKASIVPIERQLLLARYQTSLDNQLFKAIAALRASQDARRTGEGSNEDVIDEAEVITDP